MIANLFMYENKCVIESVMKNIFELLVRYINNKTRGDHTNMKKLREELQIMSVNQLSVYHVAIEMFNIINNSSSEPLQRKMKIESLV